MWRCNSGELSTCGGVAMENTTCGGVTMESTLHVAV